MSRYNSQRAVSPLSYQEVVQYTGNLVPANMASKLRTQDGGGEIFKCSIWCLLPAADQNRRGQEERRAQQKEQVGGISGLVYASTPGCTMKKTISKNGENGPSLYLNVLRGQKPSDGASGVLRFASLKQIVTLSAAACRSWRNALKEDNHAAPSGIFLAWVEWCEADLIPYKAFSVVGFGAIFSISQAFSGSERSLAGPSSG
jgi:hypothetical protein